MIVITIILASIIFPFYYSSFDFYWFHVDFLPSACKTEEYPGF